jgi:uncharacterized protein (TIGR02231 family)
VNNIAWTPNYNIYSTTDSKIATVEYGALIYQNSGEDWENCQIILSTASTDMAAERPILAPMAVSLVTGKDTYSKGSVQSSYLSRKKKMKTIYKQQRMLFDRKEQWLQNYDLNLSSNDNQLLEWNMDADDIKILSRSSELKKGGLAVNYPIGRLSLATQNGQQLVKITNLKLPAVFSLVGTPLLTPYVFREAFVSNNTEYSLLKGVAKVYYNKKFVGIGNVPIVTSGQKFVIGFGVDPKLRVIRTIVSKKETIDYWGSDKEITMEYKLRIENYKNKPVSIKLVDRIPKTKKGFKVELLNGKEKLSKEKKYRETLLKEGILQWEQAVEAKSNNENKSITDLLYRVKITMDKKKVFANQLSGTKKMELRKNTKVEFDKHYLSK